MSQLKYYYDLMSQPCRTIYMLMKINKIPFQSCPVALRKGENNTEEYKKIHPFNLVPALHDGDFKIIESVAIAKYLIGKYDLPEHWFPRTDLRKQTKTEEFLHWHQWNPRWNASILMQRKLIIPMKTYKLPTEEQIQVWRANMKKSLINIENYFLKDHDYLGGNDEISLADLVGITELMQLVGCNEKALLDSSPVIVNWMERVKDQLQPHFDDAHKFLYLTRDNYPNLIEQIRKKQAAGAAAPKK